MTDKSTAKDVVVGGYDYKVPFEHQYDSKEAAEVSYYMYKRFQSTATPTLALNGTSTSEWELSPQLVYNLSKSYLEADFTMNAPGADIISAVHAGFCSLIDTIELVDASGQRIVQITQVPYYTKLIYRPTTSMTDFLSNSVTRPAPTVVLADSSRTSLFHRSNVAGPATVALTNANAPSLVVVSSNTGAAFIPAPASISGTIEAYTSVASCVVATTDVGVPTANTALSFRLSLPLEFFAGTFFSINKDMFYNQTMRIRVTWNAYSKMGFQAAANGTGATPLTAQVAIASNSDIIRLAVQANPLSVDSVKRRVLGAGVNLHVPFVTSYKYTPAITPINAVDSLQTFQKKLTSGLGQRLLRVYSGVFNAEADNGGIYYCQNQAISVTNTRANGNRLITRVFTKLDDQNLQDQVLEVSNGDLYRQLQSRLDESVCGSNAQFLISPFMLDDWTPWRTIDSKDGDNMISGLSLETERMYEFNAHCNQVGSDANLTVSMMMFPITQKLLTVTKEGITFA